MDILGLALSLPALAGGAVFVQLLEKTIEGDDSPSLRFGDVVLVTLAGMAAFPLGGWRSTVGILCAWTALRLTAAFMERRRAGALLRDESAAERDRAAALPRGPVAGSASAPDAHLELECGRCDASVPKSAGLSLCDACLDEGIGELRRGAGRGSQEACSICWAGEAGFRVQAPGQPRTSYCLDCLGSERARRLPEMR